MKLCDWLLALFNKILENSFIYSSVVLKFSFFFIIFRLLPWVVCGAATSLPGLFEEVNSGTRFRESEYDMVGLMLKDF